MKKRFMLISYYTALFFTALLAVYALTGGTRLNIGSAFSNIASLPKNASAAGTPIPFINGQGIRMLLSYLMIITVPALVFLSGFTMFSVSFTTISVFILSFGVSSAALNGGFTAKAVLLISLALSGTVLIGAYSAEHRSGMRYTAPDINRLLRRPATKRYVKKFLYICSIMFVLTAAVNRLPLPE